jgi:Uma2 family endonuclease
MKPLIEMPPRTMMEVYKTLPEGTLAEIIDNQIYMSPSLAFNHQDVLIEIASRLRQVLKGKGIVTIAPFDVFLDETSNAVQPDIVIILNGNEGKLNKKGHFHGVPDAVVEILSPGNRDYDMIHKRDLYQKFGVKEYWIVDPETKLGLVFTLSDTEYKLIGEDIGQVSSALLQTTVSF